MMAITFCRSIGRLMRFDRQRFTLLATSVVRRTAFHRSHGVSLELDKQIACFSTSLLRNFYSTQPSLQKETVTVYFRFPDGSRKMAKAKIGDNLLDVVLSNNLDIDGYVPTPPSPFCYSVQSELLEINDVNKSAKGIIYMKNYSQLSQKPTDEELDMLDLAYGLSDTSRLGCQVIVTKDMNDWEVDVPGGTADARA